MTRRLARSLTGILAAALDPSEREAVLGDLAETSQGPACGIRDLLGLVARRQLFAWKSWQPWVVAIVFIMPISIWLTVLSRRIADSNAISLWRYSHLWEQYDLYNVLFYREVALFSLDCARSLIALACFAWAIGFSIGALARRTLIVSGALFCVPLCLTSLVPLPSLGHLVFAPPARSFDHNGAVFTQPLYVVILPALAVLGFALYPALRGIAQGGAMAQARPQKRGLLFAAIATTIGSVAIRNAGRWWPLLPYSQTWSPMWGAQLFRLLTLLIYWPAVYWIVSRLRGAAAARSPRRWNVSRCLTERSSGQAVAANSFSSPPAAFTPGPHLHCDVPQHFTPTRPNGLLNLQLSSSQYGHALTGSALFRQYAACRSQFQPIKRWF